MTSKIEFLPGVWTRPFGSYLEVKTHGKIENEGNKNGKQCFRR